MKRGIRGPLSLAALLGVISMVAALGTATATANVTTCGQTPDVPGYTFDHLGEKGIGCDHARDRAVHVLHHGDIHQHPWHYDDFLCESRLAGGPHTQTFRWDCKTADGSRQFLFQYRVL